MIRLYVTEVELDMIHNKILEANSEIKKLLKEDPAAQKPAIKDIFEETLAKGEKLAAYIKSVTPERT